MESFIFGLDQLRKEDNVRVGKKCANLGELTHAGFRVPPGFALTLEAYSRFMKETGLISKIEVYLSTLELNPGNAVGIKRFDEASAVIRKMVDETEMPQDIESAIREHYQALCEATGVEAVPVSTRSAGADSHPGQYESYLHICGASDVVHNVKRVWSSTFNTRSLVARSRYGLSLAFDPIGVAVLKMVNARAAGVMFTVNPSNGDPSKVYIESNWGLGESVVSGEVLPDSFLLEKVSSQILKRNITPKTVWYVPDQKTGHVSAQVVPEDIRNASSLNDEEILELTRLGGLIEDYFGVAQDIEWTIDSSIDFPQNLYILQTRPVTSKFQKKSASDRIVDMMMRGIPG